jgi:hypothetical protein
VRGARGRCRRAAGGGGVGWGRAAERGQDLASSSGGGRGRARRERFGGSRAFWHGRRLGCWCRDVRFCFCSGRRRLRGGGRMLRRSRECRRARERGRAGIEQRWESSARVHGLGGVRRRSLSLWSHGCAEQDGMENDRELCAGEGDGDAAKSDVTPTRYVTYLPRALGAARCRCFPPTHVAVFVHGYVGNTRMFWLPTIQPRQRSAPAHPTVRRLLASELACAFSLPNPCSSDPALRHAATYIQPAAKAWTSVLLCESTPVMLGLVPYTERQSYVLSNVQNCHHQQ